MKASLSVLHREALARLTPQWTRLADLKTPRLHYVAFNDLAQMGHAEERRTPIVAAGTACGEQIDFRRSDR